MALSKNFSTTFSAPLKEKRCSLDSIKRVFSLTWCQSPPRLGPGGRAVRSTVSQLLWPTTFFRSMTSFTRSFTTASDLRAASSRPTCLEDLLRVSEKIFEGFEGWERFLIYFLSYSCNSIVSINKPVWAQSAQLEKYFFRLINRGGAPPCGTWFRTYFDLK